MKKSLYLLSILYGLPFYLIAQIPTNGLVGCWPFNGNANDGSGNNNNGIVIGATLVSDRFGNEQSAYRFANNPTNGIQAVNYIKILDKPTLRPTTGFTISAWIYTSNSEGRCIIGKHFGTSYQDSYLLWYNVGTLWFTLYPFESTGLSNTIPSLNNWHLITGTWDNQYLRMYIDGVEVRNKQWSTANMYDASPLIIGADNDDMDDNPDDGWDGLIDDVLIYNRALSVAEIQSIFNALQAPCSSQTSVKENTFTSNNFKVYPNPTKDKIFINLETSSNQITDFKLRIINSTGSLIFESDITEQLYEIDAKKLCQRGLLFIQIIDKSNQIISIREMVLD